MPWPSRELDLPADFAVDDDRAEPIGLPPGVTELPPSSSPRYTLYRLMRRIRPRNILEIGTQFGGSAVAMGLACRDNGGAVDITCVDPFLPTGDNDGLGTLSEWYGAVRRFGFHGSIRLLMTTSDRILPVLGEQFDIVFVDGDHTYECAKSDCLMALTLLRPGGYLLAHDYMFYDSVRKAFDEVVSRFRLHFGVNSIQRNYRGDLCGWAIARVATPPDWGDVEGMLRALRGEGFGGAVRALRRRARRGVRKWIEERRARARGAVRNG